MRTSAIKRETAETKIDLTLCLEGGPCAIDTGVGFLDHMLTLLAGHSRFGLQVTCKGDTNVDDHHTLVEGEYTWVALQLQEKLRATGYLKMDGPSTGYYGPQTAKAIAAFQQDHGLPATGQADLETQRMVLEG
jgi:hypothetical protein